MTSPFTRAIQQYRQRRATDVGGSPHAFGKARQFGIHPPIPCFLEPFEDGVPMSMTDPDTELYSAIATFHELKQDKNNSGIIDEVKVILTFHQALSEINLQNFHVIQHFISTNPDIELIPVVPETIILEVHFNFSAIKTDILDTGEAAFYKTMTWNKLGLLTVDAGTPTGRQTFKDTVTVNNPDEDLDAPIIDPLEIGMLSEHDEPLWGMSKYDTGPYFGMLLELDIFGFPSGTGFGAVTAQALMRTAAPLQETGRDRGFVGNLDILGTTDEQIINEARP